MKFFILGRIAVVKMGHIALNSRCCGGCASFQILFQCRLQIVNPNSGGWPSPKAELSKKAFAPPIQG